MGGGWLGQAGDEIAALHFHRRFLFDGVGGADLDLDVLGRALADHEIVGAAHVIDDRFVELVTRDANAAAKNNAAERDDGDLGRAAADINDHVAGRFLHRETDADRRGQSVLP